MQALSASKELAQVDRDLLVQRTRSYFEWRAVFDIDSMTGMMAPDAVFRVLGSPTIIPFAGRFVGLAAIREAYRIKNTEYGLRHQDIRNLIVDGDTVAISRTAHLRHRGTCVARHVDFFDWLRFRDGLIVELTTFGDTMAIADLLGNLSI
jgi:ketosteroid isomerase-like protein